MKLFCPACGCQNEVHSKNVKVRCIRCNAVFSPPENIFPEDAVPADTHITDGDSSFSAEAGDTAAGGYADSASAAAKASVDAASSVLEAARKGGANVDPEWTANILAEAAKAAAMAVAAAETAKAAAENAAATAAQNVAATAVENAAATASENAATTASASNSRRETDPVSRPASAEPGPVQPARPDNMKGAPREADAGKAQTAHVPEASRSVENGTRKNPSGPRYVWRQFADGKTGIVLAKAVVPESFKSSGNLLQTWQSDLVPFTASFQASSQDGSVMLASTSGEMYAWYLNPMIRSLAAKTPNVIRSSFREFMEPDEYLRQYAQNMAGIKLTPTARALLPSVYGRDLAGERQRLLEYVESHMINITVRETVSTCYCDAFLYRYEGEMHGRKIVVLAGCDYKGIESYDANGGPAGLGLFSMGMQGGLLGHLMRGRKEKAAENKGSSRGNRPLVSETGVGAGNIPFGHGKEYGKNVDLISWGSERLYFMAAPAEAEEAAAASFLRFVGSITPDPALWKRRALLIEQKHQSRILEAQQLHNQAVQMQIQAQQRQQELARQIQANSEEISRGIMDSWEKQSASHSRISNNWSQAIRGVDSYRTPSGGFVEAGVSADHVYLNQYGDTIEVSGTALDDELVSRLDWTELSRER